MPAILDRLKKQLMDQGKDEVTAIKIATKALQKSGNLYPGTQTATPQGEARGAMTPDERARDRAKKLFRSKKQKAMKLPKIRF